MAVAEVEAEVRRLCDASDHRGAATLTIREYGPEVVGFLFVLTRDHAEAGDIFADVCVRIWKSLTTFRWQCSLRTWLYVLARRAFSAYRRERDQWRERRVPLSQVPEIDALITQVGTTTLARIKGEPQTRAQRIREQLTPEEQTLLTLRLDRGLEWREIVQVLEEGETESSSEDAITREAAALRKRFERLKERLKRLAAEDQAS